MPNNTLNSGCSETLFSALTVNQPFVSDKISNLEQYFHPWTYSECGIICQLTINLEYSLTFKLGQNSQLQLEQKLLFWVNSKFKI